MVCGPVCGGKQRVEGVGGDKVIRERGRLEVKAKETRHAAFPPLMFLALGVSCCVLFKGSLASFAWASA